jgi:hypothetical protein
MAPILIYLARLETELETATAQCADASQTARRETWGYVQEMRGVPFDLIFSSPGGLDASRREPSSRGRSRRRNLAKHPLLH